MPGALSAHSCSCTLWTYGPVTDSPISSLIGIDRRGFCPQQAGVPGQCGTQSLSGLHPPSLPAPRMPQSPLRCTTGLPVRQLSLFCLLFTLCTPHSSLPRRYGPTCCGQAWGGGVSPGWLELCPESLGQRRAHLLGCILLCPAGAQGGAAALRVPGSFASCSGSPEEILPISWVGLAPGCQSCLES